MEKEELINEGRRLYMREWREKNKERIKEYHKQWRSQNKEKVEEHRNNYYIKLALENKEVV